MKVRGGDVNAILRIAKVLAPGKGDEQLLLLIYALATVLYEHKLHPLTVMGPLTQALATIQERGLEPLDTTLS